MSPTTARADWRTPTVVLVCGGLVLTLGMGVRHGFGLFLQPISHDMGWGRETFALAIAVQFTSAEAIRRAGVAGNDQERSKCRAERGARGELAPARTAASQQQAGDIGARDEQHDECDAADPDENLRLRPSRLRLLITSLFQMV